MSATALRTLKNEYTGPPRDPNGGPNQVFADNIQPKTRKIRHKCQVKSPREEGPALAEAGGAEEPLALGNLRGDPGGRVLQVVGSAAGVGAGETGRTPSRRASKAG